MSQKYLVEFTGSILFFYIILATPLSNRNRGNIAQCPQFIPVFFSEFFLTSTLGKSVVAQTESFLPVLLLLSGEISLAEIR